MISVCTIAWLAGFLEGEGSFIVERKKDRPNDAIRITVASTDPDVCKRAADLLGARLNGPYQRKQKHHKLVWMARVSGDRAASWMMQLYPFMGRRRREAIVKALLVWKGIINGRQG